MQANKKNEKYLKDGKTHSQWSCRIFCFLKFFLFLFVCRFQFSSFIAFLNEKKWLEIILIFLKMHKYHIWRRFPYSGNCWLRRNAIYIIAFSIQLSFISVCSFFSVRSLYIESLPLKQYNTISNRLEIHGVALTSHFTLIFFSSMPFTARLCVCVKWNNWNRTVIAVHIVIISMAIAIQMKNRTPSHKNGTANVQIHCRCCCGDLVKWESKWAACEKRNENANF